MAFISYTPATIGGVNSSHSLFVCKQTVAPRRQMNVAKVSFATGTKASIDIDFTSISTLVAATPGWVQTIANAFKTLNIPEPVTAYGHPAMMGLMTLGMGGPGIALGWIGRLNENKKEGVKQKDLHGNIMWAFLLLAYMGATGGTLSTAMQGYPVWESPHFYTSLAFLGLFTVNGLYASSGFGGKDPKSRLQGRTYHAYFGIASTLILLAHVGTGVKTLLG